MTRLRNTTFRSAPIAADSASTANPETKLTSRRSTQMYTMHEALAREHMRQREDEARRHALSRELASARRWRNLERRAHAAYERHAQRAVRAAHISAVAE